MFSTALVALDLAPAEQPIIDCLPSLRAWGVQRMVLNHVLRVAYMQGTPTAHWTDYNAWLDTLAAPLRRDGVAVDVVVTADAQPAESILELADQHHADLIVVGSRGHNLLGRMFLGSTAREVIRRARVPVLLQWIEPTATGTEQNCIAVCTDTLRHIVLATDFSPEAAAAERAALWLAQRSQRVDVVHCRESERADGVPSVRSAENRLADIAAELRATSAACNPAVLSGKPAEAIAAYAADNHASLIVVGKRGRNKLASVVLGSTAARVCELAGRPVLVVP